MPAIWPDSSSRWRRGPRRSNWCWAACAEAGRRTARRGRRNCPQLSQGVPRRWNSRCNPGTGTPRRTARPRPHRGETGMPRTATTTRRCCAAGLRNWNRERVDAGGGGGSQKKTQAPIRGACRTGKGRCRSTRPGLMYPLDSLACLPGIAPWTAMMFVVE